jgi:hypothetical protein
MNKLSKRLTSSAEPRAAGLTSPDIFLAAIYDEWEPAKREEDDKKYYK